MDDMIELPPRPIDPKGASEALSGRSERLSRSSAERSREQEEEEIDNRVPENVRFKQELISRVQGFQTRVLVPWLNSAQVMKTLVAQEIPFREVPKIVAVPESGTSHQSILDEIARLRAEATTIEGSINEGDNPWILNDRERSSKIGALKRFWPGYAKSKDAAASTWIEAQHAKVSSKRLGAENLRRTTIDEVISSVEELLQRSSRDRVEARLRESEELKDKKPHTAELLPLVATEVRDSIATAQERINELQKFVQETTTPKDEREKAEKRIAQLQKRITDERHQVGNKVLVQIDEVAEYAVKLGITLAREFGKHPPIGSQGLLDKFLMIPSKEQAVLVEEFREALKKYFDEYEDERRYALTRSSKDTKLYYDYNFKTFTERLPDEIRQRRQDYVKTCEQLREAIVCHRSPKQTAMDILREGSLRSSAEISYGTGKKSGNSKSAVQFQPLWDVSFSINGAEDQYGWTWEELTTNSSKIRREGNMERGGVIFAYTFADAVEGKPFYTRAGTQGKQVGHSEYYEELHVQAPGYDVSPLSGSSRYKPPAVVVSLDKAIILIAEEEKSDYMDLLLKPAEEGGAGKNAEWIGQHVRFYPQNVNPYRIINSLRHSREYQDLDLRVPKEEGSYFKPAVTPRGDIAKAYTTSQMIQTPLFEWVKAA